MISRRQHTVTVVAAAAFLSVLARPVLAQSGCPGTVPPPAVSVPFPIYSNSASAVVAGDNYVYALSQAGFTRTNIANPDQPGIPQLGQIGHNRGTGLPGDGGKIVLDCDCNSGGTVMAAAEDPASGNSRVISDWHPGNQSQIVALPNMVATAVGVNFGFGNQVNAQSAPNQGTPIAAIYTSSGKFFGFFPGAGVVQTVDLTVTTGISGQNCPGQQGCDSTPFGAPPHLQPAAVLATSPWNVNVGGLWAGSASIAGATTYLLVGTSFQTGSLLVATINGSTGVATPIGSVAYGSSPFQISIGSVFDTVQGKFRAFIFSAENHGGVRAYEVQFNAGTGTYSIVGMPQPVELATTGFQTVDNVVVKGDPAFPNDPPLLFVHRTGTPDNVEIWDTTWLYNGQPPRLGAKVLHLGKTLPDGSTVNSSGFGVKVKKSGSTVNAYVFEVVFQPNPGLNPDGQDSISSSRRDVSCIALDPTAPAVAAFQMTNMRTNAQSCGSPNPVCYYGDRWRITNATATGIPLNLLQWDLVAPDTSTSSLTPDIPTWAMASPGTVPQSLAILDGGSGDGTGPGIFWPCDPTPSVGSPGNPTSGLNCSLSIGAPNGPQTFNIKLLAQNTNPPGASIAAGSQTIQAPVVYVNGQTGNPIPTPISVLTGQGLLNVLGSPATQGNTAGATFQWTFQPSGSATGASITIPANVTAFTLSTTYGDGFAALPVSGAISQTDLVAAFSLQSSTVLASGSLTVINNMQKAASATLDSVVYTIAPGGPVNATLVNCQVAPPLPAFCSTGGLASVTAPAAIGNYTISLTFNYHGQLPNQQQTPPPQSFTTVNWAPAPTVGVFTDVAGTIPASFFPPPTLLINNTYYVKDTEVVPNGITYPGADYYYSANSSSSLQGDTLLGHQNGPGQTTQLWVPQSAQVCSTCYVKAVVLGVVSGALPVVVASSSPLSASVIGPSPATGSVGVPVSFTANVSGGTQPYSYTWACQYAGQFSSFVPGGLTTQCTYPSATTYQVAVKVTDSSSNVVLSSPFTIVIGGGGGGSLSASVSGPTTGSVGAPLTFTANPSGGTPPYSYQWTCQYAGQFTSFLPGGTTNACTYGTGGTNLVVVRVSDSVGGLALSGPFTVVITGTAAPSAASNVSVDGTVLPSGGTYTVESGKTVTFTALEAQANVAGSNGYTWTFPDGSVQHGQQVTFSFSGTGAKQVGLTVVGDGTNRAGTTPATILFNIIAPSFQAMLVSSAEHSAVLTDPNGVLKFWATDVSVANPGTTAVTISPAFLSFTATQGLQFDLSTINFDPSQKVTIPPGGQHSWVDIVKVLAGDVANKGTLVLKYENSSATPLVTARVYFAPAADPLGPASGSALPAFRATSDGQVVTQGTQAATEQALPGLRGDLSYYFRLTLFNSSSTGGTFRVSAVDDRGVPATILDPTTHTPAPGGVDFAIGPYRAIDWSNDDLGLNDPARRYVLKAHRTSAAGHLVASAAVRDRLTRDQVLVTSDAPPGFQENCVGSAGPCVNYIVPGASRFLGATGARWRTGLAIFNPSLTLRGIGLEYHYQDTGLSTPEQIAKGFFFMNPGQLLFWDDVVAQVFANTPNNLADDNNGTAGVLKVVHFADGDTATLPLIISARNYDDQSTGTVGSQLSVYTRPLSLGPNEPSLRLAGVQADDSSNPKPRFETILSVFSFDDTQTTVRLTAIKSDGTVLGFHDLVLNQPGGGGHFQPRNLNLPELHAVVNEPVTIKVDVMSGGRVGAYALVRDLVTRDPTYVQAVPQN